MSTYAKALGGEFEIKIDCDPFKAVVIMPRGDEAKRSRNVKEIRRVTLTRRNIHIWIFLRFFMY